MELDLNNLVEEAILPVWSSIGFNDIVVKNRLPNSRVSINCVSHGDDHLMRMIKIEFVLPKCPEKEHVSSVCKGA